ncbi:hypothetical protein C2S52_010183 [Perilla frutescens var. hirtella]|uniref:Uncharacterized protein n=1 Tax=Perilla frutescens var. hirtella TaxID=608512 RepID=A0AAD4IN78_PERFH|nr:hypothetical protein C2S53_010027 [Perilla frutescens var. hirtella]KAH6778946.1 hypothetical protein C2S52_010183 [Perilla frutescens var. hirtella]KAH6817024.1 hypothetical protein C2S51_000627 [Perilla frutescens var. frutescens]
MIFPAVAPLAKLGLIAGGVHPIHGLGPVLTTAMLWPFVVKFAFSFRPLRESCMDMAEALRLFLFQLSQIAFEGGEDGGGPRWQRALRLVYERLLHVRRSQSDEESLLALSMHAL